MLLYQRYKKKQGTSITFIFLYILRSEISKEEIR